MHAIGVIKLCAHTAELQTEEGYSADIVQTYIPGDIMSAHHLPRETYIFREMHNVRTISFFGFQLCCVFYLPGVCTHTESKTRVRNILNPLENTRYLMNTL